MSKRLKVLVTKKLTLPQLSYLGGMEVHCKPLINIAFNLPKIKLESSLVSHAVFTSQQGVVGALEVQKISPAIFQKVYCVGDKTAKLLGQKGLEVAFVASNINDLHHHCSGILIDELHCFVGNRSLIVPYLNLWSAQGVAVHLHQVYRTELTPQFFNTDFDVVLFFSPSGVESYLKAGNKTLATAVCIGESTAKTAHTAFKKVWVAKQATVASVLEKVLSDF